MRKRMSLLIMGLLLTISTLYGYGQQNEKPTADKAAYQTSSKAVVAPPPGPADQTPAVGPSLASALALAKAALMACESKGAAVVVSVVNSKGLAKVTLAADGSTGKGYIAVRKALTAVTFKASGSEMETRAKTDKDFAELIAENPTLYNNHTGSLVLKVNGEIVGGIGITGVHSHELCEECCRDAVESVSITLQ